MWFRNELSSLADVSLYIDRTAEYQVIISVMKRGTRSVSGTSESFDTLTRLHARKDFVEYYGRTASGLNVRLSLCKPWRQIGVFSRCIHFLSLALHGSRSLFNNQPDASIIQRESGWNCLYFHPDSAWKRSSNLHETYQCRMYSRKLLTMGREDAPKCVEFYSRINLNNWRI